MQALHTCYANYIKENYALKNHKCFTFGTKKRALINLTILSLISGIMLTHRRLLLRVSIGDAPADLQP